MGALHERLVCSYLGGSWFYGLAHPVIKKRPPGAKQTRRRLLKHAAAPLLGFMTPVSSAGRGLDRPKGSHVSVKVTWFAQEYLLIMGQHVEPQADGTRVVSAEVAGTVEAIPYLLA